MNQETKDANAFLATEPLGKLLRQFSLPCVISLLVGALYNIVDQIFIANASYLGSYGNAANSVVFPLTIIALAIATMIGDGCAAYSSISLGNRNQKTADRSTGAAILLLLASSAVILVLYLIFAEPLIKAFGGDVNEQTFRLARQYLFWLTLGMPVYVFGQGLNPVIRSDGSPRFAMVTLMVGACINIVLDPIFIFVTHWGMMGAAVATIIGQYVSAAMSLWYCFHMKAVHLQRDCFRMRGSLYKRMLPLGITSFLSQISNVLSLAAVLNMAKKYGALDPVYSQAQYAQIPTAVIGIVMKIFQMVMAIAIGIAAGAIGVVGYNVGAGRYDRARGLMRRVLLTEAIVGLIATILFEAIPGPVMNVFGAAHESIYYREFAVRCIRIFLSMMVFACVNKGMFIFLQSLGKAKESIVLSMTREIVFGVGLVLILPIWMGLDGVLYYMPLADILTFFITIAVLFQTNRELKRRMAEAGAASAAAPAAPQGSAKTDYIITIVRTYGAGGRALGRALAEHLQIPYYDTELLDQTARTLGMDRKYPESIDEKKLSAGTIYSYSVGETDQRQLIYEAQTEILEKVADQGPCVIIGRRADRVLSGRPNLLRVFVTASPERRCRRIMERDGLTEEATRRKMTKMDRERAAYYNQLCEGDAWGRPDNYDLCFDLDSISETEAIFQICQKAEDKFAKNI